MPTNKNQNCEIVAPGGTPRSSADGRSSLQLRAGRGGGGLGPAPVEFVRPAPTAAELVEAAPAPPAVAAAAAGNTAGAPYRPSPPHLPLTMTMTRPRW
jgi:hypothetical protein